LIVCPSCASNNPDNAKFCNQCGEPITGSGSSSHKPGCLCQECMKRLAVKAWKFYEENREDIDLLISMNYPLAKELTELAMMGKELENRKSEETEYYQSGKLD